MKTKLIKKILIILILILSYSSISMNIFAIDNEGVLTKEDLNVIDDFRMKNGYSFFSGYHVYEDWRIGTRTDSVAPKAGFVITEQDNCSFLPKVEIKANTAPNEELPRTTGIKHIKDIGSVEEGNQIIADTTRKDVEFHSTPGKILDHIQSYDWQFSIFDENWDRVEGIVLRNNSSKIDLTKHVETLSEKYSDEGYKNFGLFLNVEAGSLASVGIDIALNHNINGNHRAPTDKYIIVRPDLYKNKKVGYTSNDVHPKNVISYSGWPFNAARFTVNPKLKDEPDLEVVSIGGGEYQPGEKITVPVKVRNNWKKEKIESIVTFEWDLESPKEIPVILEPGESKVIYFNITIPNEDNKSWKIRADINKKRDKPKKEITFDNNQKIGVVKTPEKPVEPKPLACPSTYDWIEEEIKMEPRTYCSTDGDGNSSCSTIMVPVTYYFGYNATLTSKQTIKDDKETQTSNTKINLKSGYGFKVDLEGKLTIKQTSGPWARQHTKSVQMPTMVKVTTSWEVKQINNIGKETNLELVSTNVGINGGTFKYTTPINPNSENNRRVIYTDLNLKGNKDNHVDHKFITSTTGKIGSQSLCNDLIGNITIVGNMYEDYRIN